MNIYFNHSYLIGLNFEAARNQEYQRTISTSKVAAATNVLSENDSRTSSSLLNGQSLQSSETFPGQTTATGSVNNTALNKLGNLNEINMHEASQYGASGAGLALPSRDQKGNKVALAEKQPRIGLPFHQSGTTKQQLLPEKIDFVIANGANGFVFLDEVTGSGQRIELPRKESMANLSIETKSRFRPLTFKATMKDSSQKLYVNGKEELDVASEALSPYWLIVHSKGELICWPK